MVGALEQAAGYWAWRWGGGRRRISETARPWDRTMCAHFGGRSRLRHCGVARAEQHVRSGADADASLPPRKVAAQNSNLFLVVVDGDDALLLAANTRLPQLESSRPAYMKADL
ncbi:hypothetical protein DFH06DRAFT_1123774 [Mycena polygramma]|nr:hypothetical protein DFH06DRAFT_1123774 [Mycena polygramma]